MKFILEEESIMVVLKCEYFDGYLGETILVDGQQLGTGGSGGGR